jgi:hypothetical protein
MRLLLAVALSVAFGSSAGAYQQVITETGEVVAWPTPNVSFAIDDSLPPGWDKQAVEDEVLASKVVWEELECSPLTLEFAGWTSEGTADLFDKQNHLMWVQDDWQFGGALMAITLLEFSKFTGELRDADILVNNNQKTFDVGVVCDGDGFNYDLRNILTHEFGHFVGLNHSDDVRATMFADAFEGDCAKRDLNPDDIDGFCATYEGMEPATPDTGTGDASSEGTTVEGAPPTSDGCASKGTPNHPWLPLGILGFVFMASRRSRQTQAPSSH